VKWDEKVEKVRQVDKIYRDDVQRAAKDDLKKVGKWQKDVSEKESQELKRTQILYDNYNQRKDAFNNYRTQAEKEADEAALDQLRLQ
jgi:hypothetical protein